MAESLTERLDRTIDLVLTRGDAMAALADAELAPLAVLANEVRFCPRPAFKARLRANLERRMVMSTALEAVELREGFTTVTPYLQVRDQGLFDFLVQAFGAVETASTKTPRGLHREVRVGNSMLMIGEGGVEVLAHSPGAFHVYVPDVDTVYQRALDAGARSLGAPEDRSYGERAGFVEDAFGNHWYIATSLGPTPVPEGRKTVTPFIHPRGVPSYIDFLSRAFGAIEEFRHEVGDIVMHASIRIGNAAIEMGDTQGQSEPMPAGFYLYVPDVDALYERAVAAGATPLIPPADQWYGDRMAVVKDTMGITWVMARPIG
ncbi:MAG: VOC family protein [Vicinamibacterales bacterium]